MHRRRRNAWKPREWRLEKRDMLLILNMRISRVM
jgi:hypothetical protein